MLTDALGNGSGTTAGTQSTKTSPTCPRLRNIMAGRRRWCPLSARSSMGWRGRRMVSSREVSGRARKDRWGPWEVYEAFGVYAACLLIYNIDFSSSWLALMEYHCLDEKKNIWSRIFEQVLSCSRTKSSLRCGILVSLISFNDDNSPSFLLLLPR